MREFINGKDSGVVYLATADASGKLIAATDEIPDFSGIENNLPIDRVFNRDDIYDVSMLILLSSDEAGALYYGLSLAGISKETRTIYDQYTTDRDQNWGCHSLAAGGVERGYP